MTKFEIDVLCVDVKSNYKTIHIPGVQLNCWDEKRDVFKYKPTGNPIIAHPPCQHWGKLKAFAKKETLYQKELGIICVELVNKYKGIIEQPLGSSLFKDLKPVKKIRQQDYGFPATKETLLYHPGITMMPEIIKFDALRSGVANMDKAKRSTTTYILIEYLVKCIINSFPHV